MAVLNGSKNSIRWVISPIRETFERRRAQQTIRDTASIYSMDKIVLEKDGANVRVAYSKTDGQDWAMTLKSKIKASSYIYCESRASGDFLFMRIENGALREDRIINSEKELERTILAVITGMEHREVDPYTIEAFDMQGVAVSYSLLKSIAGDKDIITIMNSYVETLPYDEKYTFKSINESLKGLTNTVLQMGVAAALACAAAVYYAVPKFMPEPIIERVVTKEPYQTYMQTMMVQSSAAVRMAQDFNIQNMLKKHLQDWRVYKVEHVHEGIFYSVYPDETLSPSTANLQDFATNNNFQLLIEKGEVRLFTQGIQAPPYMTRDDVVRYDIDGLVINISDNAKKVTPFAKVMPGPKRKNDPMVSQELTIELTNAIDHDLLRIAALVDGYPHRYPILLEHGTYTITPTGEYSGQILVSAHGEDKDS